MAVCDVPVISTVCNIAGEAAATLVSAPLEWVANAVGNAAAWMFEGLWGLFDTTTRVDVTSGEYIAVYNLLFGVAIYRADGEAAFTPRSRRPKTSPAATPAAVVEQVLGTGRPQAHNPKHRKPDLQDRRSGCPRCPETSHGRADRI